MKETDKKIFLIVSANKEKRAWIEKAIQTHITSPTIFTANDGSDGLLKLKNAPPQVVITDINLPRTDGYTLAQTVLNDRNMDNTAIVFADPPPVEAIYLDQLVTGRVQFFLTEFKNSEGDDAFARILFRGMNYVSHHQNAEYYIRFLADGDILMREGEKADFVYFVRKGSLRASHTVGGKSSVLGDIGVGEFVGEMAYFNGEPRSATVQALSDCELIEVPMGTFESILYTRPAWSRALMLTLTKRLKIANEAPPSKNG